MWEYRHRLCNKFPKHSASEYICLSACAVHGCVYASWMVVCISLSTFFSDA